MTKNSSIHHVESLTKSINTIRGESSVKKAITNGGDNAGVHDLKSQTQRNLVPFAKPRLKSTKIVPSCIDSNCNCLFLKVPNSPDKTEICLFHENISISKI